MEPSRDKMICHLLVYAKLPYGVTPKMFADYVRGAVRSWDGQLQPPNDEDDGDPLWGIGDRIKVRPNYTQYRKIT